MMSDTVTILVPGQPVQSALNSATKGPALKYGAGTYEREGVVRASLVGSLENKSGVRECFCFDCSTTTRLNSLLSKS